MSLNQEWSNADQPYGNLFRLSERREIAIYFYDSGTWVADFSNGRVEMCNVGSWFALNGRQLRRRIALDSIAPLPEDVAAHIRHLHSRMARRHIFDALDWCIVAASRFWLKR